MDQAGGENASPPGPPACCQQVASYGGQPPNPTPLASIELASVDRAALLEGIEPSNNAGMLPPLPPDMHDSLSDGPKVRGVNRKENDVGVNGIGVNRSRKGGT